MQDNTQTHNSPINVPRRKKRDASAGKFLVFPLSTQAYGIEILRVQEIISVSTITKVPLASGCIKGVINLRGKIIPVISLRSLFQLQETAYDEKTCIVIVNIMANDEQVNVGIIVDTVQEVIYFSDEQIEKAPDYGEQLDNHFIIGMGRKSNDELIVLMDIEDAIFSPNGISYNMITEF